MTHFSLFLTVLSSFVGFEQRIPCRFNGFSHFLDISCRNDRFLTFWTFLAGMLDYLPVSWGGRRSTFCSKPSKLRDLVTFLKKCQPRSCRFKGVY